MKTMFQHDISNIDFDLAKLVVRTTFLRDREGTQLPSYSTTYQPHKPGMQTEKLPPLNLRKFLLDSSHMT